ncbi:signal peptidase I [Acuticoccus sediminis]|uniref:Signal peptidase I n=1 Tax=Acuticoccus sediminis TaxID=2184697 RepID=A0A8B2P344_9HYPH|nr:signal peptidase I [Acuticoccus sediminis]RAI03029.1 signal peptidase I [Acuticoccus sediminis]
MTLPRRSLRRTAGKAASAALVGGAAMLAAAMVSPAGAQPCLCLTCVLGTGEAFRAGSVSMMPAIAPNACLVVSTTALAPGDIEPGDIVAYRRGGTDPTLYLTRIVATGGQTVRLRGGRVSIDGTAVKTEDIAPLVSPHVVAAERCPLPEGDACRVRRLRETLPNGASYEVLDLLVGGMFDDTPAIEVPEGQFFGLADNRDNGIDSRMQNGGPGFITLEEIVGRVTPASAVK